MFGAHHINPYVGVMYNLGVTNWWDPDHVDAPSGRVATATDRGIARSNATQGTFALKPKLAFYNNRWCFYLDATYCLQASGAHLAGKTNYTIAALNRHTGGSTGMVIEHSASWAANAGSFALVRGDGAVQNFSYNHRGDVGNCYAISTLTSGAMKLQTQRGDFSDTAANEVKGYIAGSAITISAHAEVDNGASLTSQTINLFSRNNGASFPLVGYVSDVWIFDRILSTSEFAVFAAVVLAMRGYA